MSCQKATPPPLVPLLRAAAHPHSLTLSLSLSLFVFSSSTFHRSADSRHIPFLAPLDLCFPFSVLRFQTFRKYPANDMSRASVRSRSFDPLEIPLADGIAPRTKVTLHLPSFVRDESDICHSQRFLSTLRLRLVE